jgi:hypothetical protein
MVSANVHVMLVDGERPFPSLARNLLGHVTLPLVG